MLRARLAVVVLAGGLGLTCGCSSLCNHPWFSKNRPCGPECIDLGVTSVSEGPVLEGGTPPVVPPNGSPLTPQTTIPSLTTPPPTAPPRLVPQPQPPQSQPMPYTP